MGENAVEIEALHKTYAPSGGAPGKAALKGVSLRVPKGKIFGLLGPNGAGKSTLINILAGLVIKTSGQVRIWGHDLDQAPRRARGAIGVMPQELNIDPFLTPRKALELQAGLYGVPPRARRTDEILDLIGLRDKAGAYARTLSGGMRRRLLLGKALVHHPHILVLDEPTAGVDIELRQMLWHNVARLNRDEGLTVILTTHYLEEAQQMCDEIAIVNHGELIAQDSTSALLNRLDAKILVIQPEGEAPDGLTPPEGVTMERRGDGALILNYRRRQIGTGAVLEAMRAQGLRLREVATQEPGLEDVFLQLTSGEGGAPDQGGAALRG